MKFNFYNIKISVSFLLVCLSALCIILGIFDGFLYCFFAVIIHETGHLVPMCVLGYRPDKIKISLFEISITDKYKRIRSDKENLIIIFFGPLANFICFIVFYLLYLVSIKEFSLFAFANLSVGLFNIMPVMSLDGGQIIYILLCKRFPYERSERIVNVLTFIIIFPLAALGFLVLFNSKYNFSLLLVCVYLVMSLVCRDNRYY